MSSNPQTDTPKTPDEIARLKAQWEADPSWDIEETVGFEEHREELLRFSNQQKAEWRHLHLVELQAYAVKLGIPGNIKLAGYIQQLESRLEKLEGRRMTAAAFESAGVAMPPAIGASLDRYANQHIETGGFLKAVLENDLCEAVCRADEINFQFLPVLVRYVYNELPAPCWGSKEKVAAWLKKSGGQ